MGEDILSVVFLAFICIIVAGILNSFMPGELMIPSFVLIAVCLWVAYDYMLLKRYKEKKKCMTKKHAEQTDDLENRIRELTEQLENDEEAREDPPEEPADLSPVAKHKNEVDIELYQGGSIQNLHGKMSCSGDTQLANRMKYMSMQSQMAKDARARWNVEKFRPYFAEELKDNERRDWWDNDADELEMLM